MGVGGWGGGGGGVATKWENRGSVTFAAPRALENILCPSLKVGITCCALLLELGLRPFGINLKSVPPML